MKLTAYKISKNAMSISPGVKTRKWMDNSVNKYAYRCLPLQIANTFGWDICLIENIIVSWNGGNEQKDLQVNFESINEKPCADSVFGMGIVTFHTGMIFVTDPGWDMYVTGIPNMPVSIYPLTGIVETDWLQFTFTMNWQLLAPGTFKLTAGTPICRIFPIPHDYEIDAVITDLSDNPELAKNYAISADTRRRKVADVRQAYAENRDVGDVKIGKPSTEWEKNYYRGVDRNGKKQYNHHVRRDFPPFKEKDDVRKNS